MPLACSLVFYRLQPEFDEIENRSQLRELIMKFEFGIERKRLVDCYAKKKVADDIEVSSRRHRLDARRKNVMSLTWWPN